MSDRQTITVPDIGDFSDVPVVEILVAEGDTISVEQSLLSLESDKATMEIPSPIAGTVKTILVKVGDDLSQGSPIMEVESAGENPPATEDKPTDRPMTQSQPEKPTELARDQSNHADTEGEYDTEVLVLGSGPGGYTAAFRAADLGLKTTLVERYPSLGGVCLNVGCIPSKALLHAAEVIDSAAAMAEHGVTFSQPEIDLGKLRGWKEKVVAQLTQGLASMAGQRKVNIVEGTGKFVGPHEIEIDHAGEKQTISFKYAIIGAGSQAVKLPGLPWDDKRLMDSTDALMLDEIPKRLLVIGGGIIGMEMASVYHGLGSEVTVCELMDQLMPGADPDLVRPYLKRVKTRYAGIHLKTKVTGIKATKKGLNATFEGGDAPEQAEFDRVLVSVGRSPNGKKIGAENAGVNVTDRGFIDVDNQQRTNVPHIFAIGDIVGQPMLAHKATHEAKVAAEVCAGQKSYFDAQVIPSVAYTDPEVAWVGLTELQAKEQGLKYGKGVFPWAASGRALGLGRTEGFTKLLFDEDSHRLLGAGIIGPHAGDLIAECAHAIEMGSDASDIGLTIHPHPTLSETVAMAAEVYEGTITDLYIPKKK